MKQIPELPLLPLEEEFLTADCGHEVYSGEKIYTWEQGTLCPDCLEDRIREMRTDELAVLLGCESAVVGTAKRDGRRKEWRFAVTDLLENSEALDGSDRRE